MLRSSDSALCIYLKQLPRWQLQPLVFFGYEATRFARPDLEIFSQGFNPLTPARLSCLLLMIWDFGLFLPKVPCKWRVCSDDSPCGSLSHSHTPTHRQHTWTPSQRLNLSVLLFNLSRILVYLFIFVFHLLLICTLQHSCVWARKHYYYYFFFFLLNTSERVDAPGSHNKHLLFLLMLVSCLNTQCCGTASSGIVASS